MHIGDVTIPFVQAIFLVLALGLALAFEFVNGFHDTANAVATVIYTNTLKPHFAVVWSGLWNLFGVLVSSGTVAYSIISLLPVELVIHVGSSAGFAMVFSLLLSAIIWNLGTWYLGLPASSSHTLVGSILGVGLAHALLMPGHNFTGGVNWASTKNVGLALLISPVVGFCFSALLLLLSKAVIKNPALYRAPDKGKSPPWWIRTLLLFTCTGVSYAHGSNDGQKGMGLIMLILIGIVPGLFALNMTADSTTLGHVAADSQKVTAALISAAGPNAVTLAASDNATLLVTNYVGPGGQIGPQTIPAIAALNQQVTSVITPIKSFSDLAPDDRSALRTSVYLVDEGIAKLLKSGKITDSEAKTTLSAYKTSLDQLTKYIPTWVKVAVAFALGLGTMVGWKRIVVTVGEKIGKAHLTYAQGASAELVAMCTILAADRFGLPVSTTHVLSSGIAGTMFANRSGLQKETLRNIILAWVLTLPVCIFLGAFIFAMSFEVLFDVLGIK
ncbi:MAG: inorganic phosphate transporter [Opitutales bacterium]|jgi:PiT family inorganic phosphate transporter